MNQARDISTDLIIDAEDLKSLEAVDKHNYECIDKNCRVKVIPSSYGITNKVRPYFKIHTNGTHTSKCSCSNFANLISQGKSRRLNIEEFVNNPYPEKLVIASPLKENVIKVIDEDSELVNITRSTKTNYSSDFDEASSTNKTVSALGQIVDFYLNCPYNRDFELNLLGTASNYQNAFMKINAGNIGKFKKEPKIYFGQLYLKYDSIKISDNLIMIKMYECQDWKDSNSLSYKEQINPFFIKINTESFKKNKVSRLIKEMEYVKEEQKDILQSGIGRKKKAFIFFYGVQSNDNEFLFEVQHGLMVCRLTEVLPKKKS